MATTVTPPSLPEATRHLLPTPCLIVDVEACERNIGRLAEYFSDTDVKLRPHFKAHKCVELMRRQLDAGSCVGVTCATAAEAALLARSGFEDILVANQVVDAPGLAALAQAASLARLAVAVDDAAQVGPLSAEAERAGVALGVLIEVDVGLGRCGLPPGTDELHVIAEAVTACSALTLQGLQGYEGHAVMHPLREERRERVKRAGEILVAERSRLLSSGFACPTISGGGTGTYDLATEVGVLTEVQAGSYALMDATYGALDLPFENALFLLSTVISHPRGEAATVNAGLKALTVEFGMAKVLAPGLELVRLADEHGSLSVEPDVRLAIGDAVYLLPAHIDPTINLHDVLFAWDTGRATLDLWPVDGRRNERAEALL